MSTDHAGFFRTKVLAVNIHKLEDKLRERLPRELRQIGIFVISYLPGEPATVIFTSWGRLVEFEVDPDAGRLTDVQIAHLCVIF